MYGFSEGGGGIRTVAVSPRGTRWGLGGALLLGGWGAESEVCPLFASVLNALRQMGGCYTHYIYKIYSESVEHL